MTPKSRDHMPTTSIWGVAAKWPTRAPKTKLVLILIPERPTRIQPYQFEPVRQDFEKSTGTSCQLRSKPHAVFHGVCEIAITEVLATHMGVIRRSKKVKNKNKNKNSLNLKLVTHLSIISMVILHT